MFITQEEGYYALTSKGTTAVIVVIVLLVILTAILRVPKEEKTAPAFTTKQLIFSAAALALAFAASYIRLFKMPWGGSVTLCSMLFVTLIGYWYGPRIGLIAAFAYGLMQFVQGGGSYILSPLQVGLDYVFAFTALGLSGFFNKQKNGLLIGYLVAIVARGFFHSIGGYLYWMDYMPDNFPPSLAAVYPFCYNYGYILAEGILTLVILSVPAVKKAMARIRTMALG